MKVQQFNETSPRDNKDLCRARGDTEQIYTSCMPKLTVKDLSRILCPSLRDAKDIRCRGTASPNTLRHGLHNQFNNLFITKDPTIRHDSVSPASFSRSVLQQHPCYRTLSYPNELEQTRDRKMIETSLSIELRSTVNNLVTKAIYDSNIGPKRQCIEEPAPGM